MTDGAKALSIAEQLLHSTIRIECRDAKGNVSTGTGFHFSFEFETGVVPAIITNRHVFDGASHFDFYYTLADADGRSTGKHERYSISEFAKAWIGHPDPKVDLAMLPIQPLLDALAGAGKRPFFINLSQGIIGSPDALAALDVIEDVTMIGYPNGLWDQVNNLPIVRRGITATSASGKYQGKSEFLIDAACFPGSSGSPVFIYNSGSYGGFGGAGIVLGTRLLLIGVLYAGHLHTAVGEIKVVPIPTAAVPIPISQIPNNLGVCIHASRLLDFKAVLKARVDADAARHSGQ